MSKNTFYCLAVLAIGSIIAIAFPISVIIGFYALILPGLFFLICPSLLLYSLLWLGARRLLWWPVCQIFRVIGADPEKRVVRVSVNFVALVVVLMLGVKIPLAVNQRIENVSAALRAEDREPAEPIALPDSVALDLPRYPTDQHTSACESMCMRLLFNGATKRVLVEQRHHSDKSQDRLSYWVERQDKCPPVPPGKPEVVFLEDFEEGQRGESAFDVIRKKIATGECLIENSAGSELPMISLSLRDTKKGHKRYTSPWNPLLDTISAQRLELIDETGNVLYRRTEVKSEPLSVPLLFSAEAGFLTTLTYAGLARRDQIDSLLGPSARDLLPKWFGKAMRKPEIK